VPRSPAVMSNSTQQQEPREDQKGLAWRVGYVLGCLTLVAIVVVGIYSLARPQEKPITYVPVNEIPKEQAAEETPAPPPVATPGRADCGVASGVGETASATSRAGETAREDPSPAQQLDGFFGQVTLPVASPGGEPGSMRTNAPNWTLNWKRDIYSTGNDRMAISRIGIGVYDRICRRSSRLSDPSATNPCACHMEDLRSTGESDWF
jgi:hypothetical protein